MAVIKRLAGVYLLAVGVAVAVHFIATQFYDPSLEGTALTVWRVLDPLMVAAVAMVFIAAWASKRRAGSGGGEQPVTRDYLEANFGFYFSGALLLALLWNWAGVEFVEPRNDMGLVWTFIDSTLPLLAGAAGVRLLRSGG